MLWRKFHLESPINAGEACGEMEEYMATAPIRAVPSFCRAAGLLVFGGLVGAFIHPAHAHPIIDVVFTDTPLCDPEPRPIRFSHELGEAPLFPGNEQIEAGNFDEAPTTCVANDDTNLNDFEIRITNTSPNSWRDLFFVADAGILFGNADGVVVVGGNALLAFRIDAVGVNRPLIGGDEGVPGRFEPGERWDFLVTNWGSPIPPTFGSLGVPSGPIPADLSTASIVARCAPGSVLPAVAQIDGDALTCPLDIPEPAPITALLIGLLGVLGLTWRHRRDRPLPEGAQAG